MNSPRRLQALVVGDWTAEEFQELTSAVVDSGEGVSFEFSESLTAAANGPAARADLIAVLQRWPDQYAASDVHLLLKNAPLARLVVACGAWCDSDGRTRDLWPPASRIPAREAPRRFQRSLEIVRGHAAALPLTASRDEIWRFDRGFRPAIVLDAMGVTVDTPDPVLFAWLRDLLSIAGCRVERKISGETSLLLWDVDPWSGNLPTLLRTQIRDMPAVPLVALAGFCRADQLRLLRRAGVTDIVSKLAPAGELLRLVQRFSRPGTEAIQDHSDYSVNAAS
jgi:hypothetical protein